MKRHKVPISKTEIDELTYPQDYIKIFTPEVIRRYSKFLHELKQRRYTWLIVGKRLNLPKDMYIKIGKMIREDYNGLYHTNEGLQEWLREKHPKFSKQFVKDFCSYLDKNLYISYETMKHKYGKYWEYYSLVPVSIIFLLTFLILKLLQ